LLNRIALDLEQARAGDNAGQYPRTRHGNVQAVPAVQEFNITGEIVTAGRNHRNQHHLGLLPL
jgi:hypothetical protein